MGSVTLKLSPRSSAICLSRASMAAARVTRGSYPTKAGLALVVNLHCIKPFDAYSITASAVANSVSGIVRPSALATLRLIVSTNLVGCCTGRSAGLAPALDIAAFLQALEERNGDHFVVISESGAEKPNHWHRRLLSARH
jgi:hypothetical protein